MRYICQICGYIYDDAKLLAKDIENYPSVRAIADASSDRGAARICV